MGDMDKVTNKSWLVKSGERILGPYSTDEVIRRIMTKEIVVIDEVIAPESRWGYVRDIPVFAQAVEEARRGLMHSREDTEVQGYTDHQVTETDHDESFSKASVVNVDPDLGYDSSRIQDASFVDKPLEAKAPLSTIRTGKQFGMEGAIPQMPQPARRSFMSRPGMWLGTFVIVAAALFAIYTSSNPEPEVDLTSIQAQANRAWNRGEFDKALDLYRRLDRGRPDIAIRLAQLMVRAGSETAEAKRLLQDVQTPSQENAEAIAMTFGLIALKAGDPRDAEKNFARAGASWMVDYNRGIASMMTQSWSKAIAHFRDAGREPIALLMLARALVAAADSPKSDLRKQAVSALERLVGRDHDYRQEALVLRSYLEASMGDLKEASRFARRAIETDPDLTVDHFHDPALNLDLTSWTQLMPACLRAGDEVQSTIGRALIALCLAKAGRLDESSKILREQLAQFPADGLLGSVSAYVHLAAGREDAARAALRAVNEPTRLGRTLQARLCGRERDDACAEDAWSRLAMETPPSLSALTGLAKIRFSKGDREGAGALLVKAETMSPRYLPLLRLREETTR
ncbi:MAG: hypothetical protein AAB250_14280 [Bdellovibrionota bacterium]